MRLVMNDLGNVLKDYKIGYIHLVNQEKLPNACYKLRAIAGNTSHINFS